MKITRVFVHRLALPAKPLASTRHLFSGQQDYDSTVVRVETESGLTGLGEVCTIGTHYMRGFPDGAAVGAATLARHLIGEDALHIDRLNRAWDRVFRDDLYVKAPLDMALWDLFGQFTGRPVCDLLGGRYEPQAPLYRSIYFPPGTAVSPDMVVTACKEARAAGFRHFQLKPGKRDVRTIDGEIDQIQAVAALRHSDEDVIVDANANWNLSEAMRAVQALRDLPVVLEQPCRSWDECLAVRKHWPGRIKLDELIETPRDVIRAARHGFDIVAIKIARVGGLSKAKLLRDLALDLGLAVVPDDAWGSQIVSSALLHLAASTDPRNTLCFTDLTDYVDQVSADGFPIRQGGQIAASSAPGLGLRPRLEVLGPPVAVIQ